MTKRRKKIEKSKKIMRNVRLFTYAMINILFVLAVVIVNEKPVEAVVSKVSVWPAEYKVVWLPHDSEKIRAKLVFIKKRYGKIIKHESDKHGVEVEVVLSIIRIESNGNADARSWAGALGPMQVKRSTAKDMHVKYPKNSRYNISAGIKYYRKMLKMFGSRNAALAAYNMGPSNFKKRGKDIDENKYFYVTMFQDTLNVLRYTM